MGNETPNRNALLDTNTFALPRPAHLPTYHQNLQAFKDNEQEQGGHKTRNFLIGYYIVDERRI